MVKIKDSLEEVVIFYATIFFLAVFLFMPDTASAAAWEISGTSYDSKSKYVGSQLERITATFFKSDGTIMYVMGGQDPSKIAQYTLSIAWDVSTASYANKVYSLRDNNIYWGEGMFFKSDGSVLYAVSSYSNKVHQFSLSTPWDISTASYSNASTSIASIDTESGGIYFKSDGTKMYLAGSAYDSVYQFSLSSPWDITTASYDSVSYAIWSHISGVGTTQGVYFKDDGTKMFTVDSASDTVYQYTLSSAWDLSTAVYDNVNYSVSSQSSVPADIFIKTDGGKLYVTEYTNVYVYQYSLADTTAPTVSSYSPADNSVDVTATSTFRVTFNESVATSTGNITLKKTSDDSVVETIDITASKVSRYSATAFTVDPAATLDAQTGYYFLIDSGSVVDTALNAYIGISATSTWNFTTENAATIQTTATSGVTVNSAAVSGAINNIKGSTVTKRGFVYGASSPNGTDWSIVGSGLAISSAGTPALAALNSTDVAFVDSTNDSLRTYRWSGSAWSLIGSGLAISTVGTPALAALSSTDVAFVDSTNDSLRTYRWSGSAWSLIGSGLAISTVGTPALAALNSTDVAFVDSTNASLRTYRFDGANWALIGSGLAISSAGTPALAALNSTDAAFVDSTNDSLRTYRWSGSAWSLIGSGLAISTVGTPALAALSSTNVAFIDSTNDSLRTYNFSGSAWSQIGNSAYFSISSPALAALGRTDIAFFDSSNISLRTYRFAMGNIAPASSGYASSTEETGSFGTGAFSASLSGLSLGTAYFARAYVQNSYGYAYGNEITFTTLSDLSDPTVLYFNPADNATGVGVNANFEIAFNEAITTSTGNIVLYKTSDDSVVETIAITGSQITASGTTALIINPSVTLGNQTEYYFTIAATAVDDTAGNSYAGITASTTWSFTTVLSAPAISSVASTPAADSSTITWTTDLAASTKIIYGPTTSYSLNTAETDTSVRVISHSAILPSLVGCTTFHYKVISANAENLYATSTDYSFITAGCTGSSSVATSTNSTVATTTVASVSLISSSTGITLAIPVGYASTAADFQIKKLVKEMVSAAVGKPSGYTEAGDYVYNLTAITDQLQTISTFAENLTITMAYTDADISGITESSLKIFRWDGAVWNELSNCVVNQSANTVTCDTGSFSTFGLYGQATPAAAASSPSGGGGGNFITPRKPTVSEAPFMVNYVIKFNVTGANQMVISDDKNFTKISWQDYKPTYSPGQNEINKTLYVKFRSKEGGESEVYKIFIKTDAGANVSAGEQVIPITPNISPRASKLLEVIPVKNQNLASRLKGKIILKVEERGQAYYLLPNKNEMYFLGSPDDAFKVMKERGIGITTVNLKKIPIGLGNLIGKDADQDGLPNMFEDAIGTDPNKKDTDNDGHDDKTEISSNFNPKGLGKFKFDAAFSNKQKGKIFLQVNQRGQAWYVNPADGKKYFLGRPADAYSVMCNLGMGISNNNFMSLSDLK